MQNFAEGPLFTPYIFQNCPKLCYFQHKYKGLRPETPAIWEKFTGVYILASQKNHPSPFKNYSLFLWVFCGHFSFIKVF